MTSSVCVFCEIGAGRTPAATVLEEDELIAFLDVRPVFVGHVLLVPRAHVPTLAELPPRLFAPLLASTQKIMSAVERALGAEGTFVATNNKVSQSVPHLHVHIVPRKKKDGLRGFFWPRTKYASDEAMRATAESIRAAIAATRA
jgi:histidine triad (HIT) family protein